MKSVYTYSSLSLLLGFILLNCDSTVSPDDKLIENPIVRAVTLSPQEITFIPTDGFKDTTITILVEAIIENVSSVTPPGYAIRDRYTSEFIASGELISDDNSVNHRADIRISTTTTSFEEYLVEVYAYNSSGNGNFYQRFLSIDGFSNSRPEITETNSPGTIVRPTSGEIPAIFTAKVTDADGDNTISRVFLRVIDQTSGEVTGSPFDMADDGTSLGDQTANDFIYTWSLPVTQTSGIQDRDFDIEFFALDQGGIYSDTVRTTFQIRGN